MERQSRTPSQSVFHWARERPDAIAIDGDGARDTYLQLAAATGYIAKRLHGVGVRKGSVVGIQCDNRYLSLLLLLAMDALRAIPAYLSKADVKDHAWLDRCDIVLAEAPLAMDCPVCCFMEISAGWLASARVCAGQAFETLRLDQGFYADDHVFLGGTSSTTGKKKFFLDRRGALHRELHLMAGLYFRDGTTNFICPYGVWLGAAYAGCFISLNLGSTIIFSAIGNLLADLERYPGSHSALVLRDAAKLAGLPLEKAAGVRFSSLRVLGAHLPNDIRDWLEIHVADRVMNSYSSNETGQVAEVLRDGSAAIYPDVEVRIVDDERRPAEDGLTGCVAIKSPAMIQGYLWNDALTWQHFRDGWFYSSDLGYMTDTGRLVIVGRADDMLNLGGVKIAPARYEQRISCLEGVSDCSLLCDNEIFGAGHLIVCVEKARNSDPGLLHERIRSILSPDFRHVTTHFLSVFPRTDTGKIRRQELKAIAKAGMAR